MTAADVARFSLIIGLGFLAFLVLIFAGTIIGSMWLEASYCNCIHLPVGLYVLLFIAILFTISIILELVDHWSGFINALFGTRERTTVTLIIIIVIIIILILPVKSYHYHPY